MDHLFSVIEVDKRMVELLIALSSVTTSRPDKYQEAVRAMPSMYHLAGKTHERGGATSDQLKAIEATRQKILGLI